MRTFSSWATSSPSARADERCRLERPPGLLASASRRAGCAPDAHIFAAPGSVGQPARGGIHSPRPGVGSPAKTGDATAARAGGRHTDLEIASGSLDTSRRRAGPPRELRERHVGAPFDRAGVVYRSEVGFSGCDPPGSAKTGQPWLLPFASPPRMDWAIALIGCGIGSVILGFFLPEIAKGPGKQLDRPREPIDDFVDAQSAQVLRISPHLRKYGACAALIGLVIVLIARLLG